jgi:hypothetical protein
MNSIQHVEAVAASIRREDGPSLRRLLDHRHLQAVAAGPPVPVSQVLRHALGPTETVSDWVDFVDNYLQAFAPTAQRQAHASPYDALLAALTPFLKLFREDEGSWLVDPMHSVVHTLHYIAEAGDAELLRGNKKAQKLVDCGDQLRKCFSVALQAPNNKDKKLAALDIVNVSIKIYFKLNTLRLCKNLIRTVESRQFPAFDQFPQSQKVTYKFYLGRLAVFDEQYEEAQDALTYALKHCHASAKKNIALVLKYLIPVGLLLGRLPSATLSRQYHAILAPYLPIADAVRAGNVGMFYAAMQEQRNRLVKDGTYLLLEKLQAAVYRRLLKKVWIIHAQLEPTKAAQIPLALFERALKVAGVDIGMDEIECITANLIVRRYVKGYISHKLKVLVVHKTQPFPDLDTVVLVDE